MPRLTLIALLLLVLAGALPAGCASDEEEQRGAAASPARRLPLFEQPPDKPAGPAAPKSAGSRRSFTLRTRLEGFEIPVQVIARPGDDRLFVVEQAGLIRTVEGGRISPTPYLDLRRAVRAGGELGLLTAAFSPDGATLTTMWTDARMDTRVTRYPALEVRAERDAEEVLLRVDQPSDYENHKGGTLLYDAEDRLLLGLGDGGSAFDPGSRAQDPRTQLGKVLRYDDGKWSTVARGLRNPYRMSLDPATDRLWIGDVGQDAVEEVDAVRLPAPGAEPLNLGWAAYEGTRPLGRKPLTGPPDALVWPVAEYRHGGASGQGCSVTGGLVHRGRGLPLLRGRYLFADFCTGELWSADALGAEDPARLDLRAEQAGPLPQVTSFGAGRDERLYATTADGRLVELISDRSGADRLG